MKQTQPTIGLVSTSYSLSFIDERLRKIGMETLNKLGFNYEVGKNAYKTIDYIAGTLDERVQDFTGFLKDSAVDIIMSVIGGYNSNQLLPHLDYDLIAEIGKKIVGFSDTTALLNAIYTKTGRVTYLGPSFVTFCNPCLYSETVEYFFRVIVQGEDNVSYIPPKRYAYDDWFLKENFGPREEFSHKGWNFVREGVGKGILVGGNLETFLSLAGTEYLPDMEGKVLLIEGNVNEKPAYVDRQLHQLEQMHVFDKIEGLIVGQYGNSFYESEMFFRLLRNVTGKKKVPIVVDAEFSHVDPIYTIPIGGTVLLNSQNKEITLLKQ